MCYTIKYIIEGFEFSSYRIMMKTKKNIWHKNF